MSKRFSLSAILLALMASLGPCPAKAQYAPGAVSWVTAANQAFGTKDYGSALLDYQAAVTVDPHCGPAYQGMGNSLVQLDELPEALSAYQKALDLKPGDPFLSKAVSQLNVRLGNAAPAPPPPPPAASPVPTATPTPVPTAAPALLASAPSNPVPEGPTGDKGRFVLSPQGGGAGSAGNPFGIGLGGGIGAGYFLNDDLSLRLDLGFYTFKDIAPIDAPNRTGLANIVRSNLEAVLGVKCRLAPGDIRPYVTAEGGICYGLVSSTASGTYLGSVFNSSAPTTGVVEPLARAGFGFEFMGTAHTDFFAEVQCDMLFGDPGTPTLTGKDFDPLPSSGDGVLVYVPVNVGFNFYL